MTRHILMTLGLAASLIACGSDAGDDDSGQDSLAAMAADTIPREPRVLAIEVGLAADSLGRIVGGVLESFPTPDTLFVAVRTQYTPAGAPLTVRLLQGDRTVDSTEIRAGEPDASQTGRAVASLPAAANASPGSYRIEVLLDGVSQGIREITLGS
jgi:hypothetical protein